MTLADPATTTPTGTVPPVVLWSVAGDDLRRRLATIAELDAAGVDAVLLPQESVDAADAVLLAGAASRRAPRIGLIVAVSPWLQPPFHTARALGTLDALSAGRAGWLVDAAPATFSSTDDTDRWNASGVTDPAELDRAAADYLTATTALWNSWEPGALIADIAAGQYVDPAKVHVPHHRGEFYAVRGPLNMPRSPQGRPVIVARWPRGRADADASCTAADVLIVGVETDVAAARIHAATVVLEVTGAAAISPPTTTADGYLFTGIDDPARYGQVVHTVLPGLLPHRGRGGLLRDRLRLPAADFDWSDPDPTPNSSAPTEDPA